MLRSLLLLAVLGSAPDQTLVYNGRANQIRVATPRLEERVEVDGALEEPAWSQAARLIGFSQYSPVDGRPAEYDTEVLVWYSPSAIHFGIRARAPEGTVRATLVPRDKIDSDDSVHVFLSTFNDGRRSAVFAVNPLGVQADGVLLEGSERRSGGFGGLSGERQPTDWSPDFVFESKGRLTAEGYEVEVRIPFKSLRYPQQPSQDWGLHVVRRVQSLGHEDTWVPARRAAASFLAQSGTLEALSGLRPENVLDLNPFLTARADGARSGEGWGYDASAPEPGGNLVWGITSNLTLAGTIQPDFSQVEADAGQLVFDPRNALFFSEKRPFFLEEIEQFATPNRLIYTRRIVEPVAAAKLTGKLSGTAVGALFAVDGRSTSRTDARPRYGLLRLQRDVGQQSKVGLAYTDKVDGADSNRVAALDGRFVLGKLYTLDLQAGLSRTKRLGVLTSAPLWEAAFERNGRRFGFSHLITGIHEDFRAESGFVRRGGVVHANADYRLTFFGKRALESWSVDVLLDGLWRYSDFTGGRRALEEKLHLNNNVRLRGGWQAGVSLLLESFGFDERLYADYALEGRGPDGAVVILPFVGTPRLSNRDLVLTLKTPQFKQFSGSLFLGFGKDENFFEWAPANVVLMTASAEWRPTEKLRVNGSFLLQDYERRSDGSTVGSRSVPRLKLEYQVSRAVFVRLVGEYDLEDRDALRDDSRTGLPILIRAPTGEYSRALAQERRTFRGDALFSFQPRPGTVVFAGYGTLLQQPDLEGLPRLGRSQDGFFLKVSYLFRM